MQRRCLDVDAHNATSMEGCYGCNNTDADRRAHATVRPHELLVTVLVYVRCDARLEFEGATTVYLHLVQRMGDMTFAISRGMDRRLTTRTVNSTGF